ncbi:ornithine decarboxylase 1-like [Episyrphus balteatus]|uniref:ornithine decarboxylase 1-like n=1 Tax=Episyrphus balteatus TaxID=286459 RepID=UPI0024863FFC|nr:ornithine decarboxylase 1-like [Episyrphus balteatus]
MVTKELESIHIYNDKLDLKSEIEKLNLSEEDDAVNFCDLTNIIIQYNTWMKYLPNVKPFYAIKCNDEWPVLKLLKNLGTGFDCASKNEIKKVFEVGVHPDRIIYANPMKSKSYIKYAQSENVTNSTVDSEFEIYKMFKYYAESNVILRFRSDAKKVLSILGNKFGCDAFENGAALMMLTKSLNMNMIGVSFHVGSGCLELEAYERAISTGSSLYKFGNLIDHNMKILDIGGGFPGEVGGMFPKIAESINNSLDEYFANLDVEVIAEPGRYFVNTAYTNISKVFSRREVRSEDGELEKIMYYVNDGVFGTFSCTLYEDLPIEAIHFKDEDSELFDCFIWGPTCDGCDKILESVRLPNLEEGDILAFPNMGAYTVPIMSTFNGFDKPKTRFYLRSDYVKYL